MVAGHKFWPLPLARLGNTQKWRLDVFSVCLGGEAHVKAGQIGTRTEDGIMMYCACFQQRQHHSHTTCLRCCSAHLSLSF